MSRATTRIPLGTGLRVIRRAAPFVACAVLGMMVTVAVSWALAAALDVTKRPGKSVAFLIADELETPHVTLWSRPGAQRVVAYVVYWVRLNREEKVTAIPAGSRSRRGSAPNERVFEFPSWSLEGRDGAPIPSDTAAYDSVVEDARGWPFLAMRCTIYLRKKGTITGLGGGTVFPATGEILVQWEGNVEFGASLRSGGIALPTIDGKPDMIGKTARALPLIPIWPGFAADTAIFSAPFFLALGALKGWKAIRRRRRVKARLCGACGYPLTPGCGVCSECGAG